MPSMAAAQALDRCARLTTLQVPGVALTVTKAEWHAAGPAPAEPPPARALTTPLPAFCRLDATIDRRVGAGGKRYGIGFALALPDTWNGRFLFQGGGGLNGRVQAPYGVQAAGGNPGLARGFAVVSTDTGHEGANFDGSFFADQQASLDFAYVAVGRVAVLAKQIVAQYYGRPADRSYFAGCSTGGREGMLMTERYPVYFDGVVAGAPAMRTGFSGIGDRWVAVALNQIAPRDAAGKPVPAQALSESDKKLIVNGLLDACDTQDGVKDGMIFNVQRCGFDPATLTCTGEKTEGCLTREQVNAVKKGFAGPKGSRGNQVYPGFFYDTGIAASGQGIPGLLSPGPGPLGPPNLSLEIDVDQAAASAAGAQAAISDTAGWTNLSSFAGHGGKLLFFHGVSDPWFSAQDTIGYYERLGRDNGGADRVSTWSRLFLVPGMGHCQGGAAALDTFDLLSAIVAWVENGVAPDAVAATGRAFPGRSRPLCPYPTYAHYKGSGDAEDGKNFECRRSD
jgi:feruloyl esterase